MQSFDALSLFSGGLDSILASKLMQSQGHRVLGLHFVSPFFGHAQRVEEWSREYGLDIVCVDIGQEFVDLLTTFPPHGFGKVLNPCVDCKILMLKHAKALLPAYQAKYIVSGEVLGQRPMSQRADALNIIRNVAGVHDLLLRPLSARLLPVTPMEESGLVDRGALGELFGRSRQGQFLLAQSLGVTKIPPQAGGCRLAEQECARRYWPLLATLPRPMAADFALSNIGRQLWYRDDHAAHKYWLSMGREQTDNERLLALARATDLIFTLHAFPGPQALGRPLPGQPWDETTVHKAAACLVSFAPKARQQQLPVEVLVRQGSATWKISITPGTPHPFEANSSWAETRAAQKQWEKNTAQHNASTAPSV